MKSEPAGVPVESLVWGTAAPRSQFAAVAVPVAEPQRVAGVARGEDLVRRIVQEDRLADRGATELRAKRALRSEVVLAAGDGDEPVVCDVIRRERVALRVRAGRGEIDALIVELILPADHADHLITRG